MAPEPALHDSYTGLNQTLRDPILAHCYVSAGRMRDPSIAKQTLTGIAHSLIEAQWTHLMGERNGEGSGCGPRKDRSGPFLRLTCRVSASVEDHNLNRLVGANAEDSECGTPKVAVLRRLIKGINPEAKVSCIQNLWQEEPLGLRDCDVLFGCVDSYGARNELERTARRFLIPYIDIGMDVTPGENGYVISGQVILSMPGELCMWCLGFLTENLLAEEAARYGAAGGRPQVVWPNGVLASTAVGNFVQLITPWHRTNRPTIYVEYDGNAHTLLPSNRLRYVESTQCKHFSSSTELGDPFWGQ